VSEGKPDPKEERTPTEVGIEIDADGRVVLTDLPPDLVDLVRELDPDAVLSCDVADGDAEPSKEDQARHTS